MYQSTKKRTPGLIAATAAIAVALAPLALTPRAAQAQAAPGVSFTLLHAFNYGERETSLGGAFTIGPNGNLYAGEAYSGYNEDGSIVEMTTEGTLTKLYDFNGQGNIAGPNSKLVLGSDGNFYGTTGQYVGETVFKVTPTGHLTILYTFPNDTYPEGDLVEAPNGLFYGVTFQGGANEYGMVYSVDSNGNFNPVYSFTGGTDGGYPNAGLVLDSAGDLYGTTDLGTVFQLTPAGTLTTLGTFTGSNVSQVDGLTLAPGGILYGTTYDGGANGAGTLFSIPTSGAGGVQTLYSFSADNSGNADGANPLATLLLGSDGNLYGSTVYGGTSDLGTLFQYVPGGTLHTIFTFSGTDINNTDGDYPQVELLESADGYLYGAAYEGGVDDGGTAFRLSVPGLTSTLVTLHPTAVCGGNASSFGTITLPAAAPAGGAVVALASSNPALATVPASVTVAAGATTASFKVMTTSAADYAPVTITAAYNGASQIALLEVTPPVLEKVTLASGTVKGGASLTGNRVYLSGLAAGDTVVKLTSTEPSVVTLPTEEVILSGANSHSFVIQTSAVKKTNHVEIIATSNGVMSHVSLTVTP